MCSFAFEKFEIMSNLCCQYKCWFRFNDTFIAEPNYDGRIPSFTLRKLKIFFLNSKHKKQIEIPDIFQIKNLHKSIKLNQFKLKSSAT